ncbi:MAG: hypothetical protein COA58_16000 [Bacteroidetes bacterium]|nr:MAG: hypothetical protein COA58_16000 [Bacteroidota bacterium]
MRQIRRFFLYILLIAVLGMAFTVIIAKHYNFSEGDRAGTIIKMSEKGYIFKTNEGQLNTGEINNGLFAFSVYDDDTAVLQDLNKALKGGYRVSIHYHQKKIQLPFYGDTKHFISKVELVQ